MIRKIRRNKEVMMKTTDISSLVLEARVSAGLTQAELAKIIGTKQPSIARVESGLTLPSLNFLQKVASACGKEIIIKLK